jgi:hydroxypyruvate reductase
MPWQTQLRADAREIFAAGVEAVEPRALVRDYLSDSAAAVAGSGRIWVAAVGKAAVAMTRGALDVVSGQVVGGVLIAPVGTTAGVLEGIDAFAGGHPIPNEQGVRGAAAIRGLASQLQADDTLLCLISGGGSALMTLPPENVPLADLQAATEALLRAGATIDELNCVRKHLDLLKGGRLAALAAPARVEALILSDVVGDPLDVIASGPVSPDSTTFADAWAVLDRRGVAARIPASVLGYLKDGLAALVPESPKAGDACFDRVAAEIVGSNRIAADAALEAARKRGYAAFLLATEGVGEAREVGHELAALARDLAAETDSPACMIAAGETTVTVRGSGKGGRNQELVLAAALELQGSERILVASMGTDGIDGPTDAAGAVADGESVARAAEIGIDLEERLADNDAYPAFEALGDLIVTGPTGTNVMDLMLVLVAGE